MLGAYAKCLSDTDTQQATYTTRVICYSTTSSRVVCTTEEEESRF